MIRNNLSTRPFYNERTVRLALALAAVVVALLTALNVSRMLSHSRSDTELAAQAAADEARTIELRAAATRLRQSVDMKALQVAASEARQANDLIDKRTFSWTSLLNLFEATLPEDVRIVSVRPNVDEQGRTMLTISLIARSVADVEQFMRNLEGTGAIRNPFVQTDALTEQDQLTANLTAEYTVGTKPAASETAPPAAAPATPQEPQ